MPRPELPRTPEPGNGPTAATPSPTAALDPASLRVRVGDTLGRFTAAQVLAMAAISPDLAELGEAIADLVRGGKRLRPAFCLWSYVGARGRHLDGAIPVAAALELVQACALIHDDVMDASDTRRGQPAAHRRFAALHGANSWVGPADRFGAGAAILAGDLCLAWADELIYGSGMDPEALARAKPAYDTMRTELMCGQYLDLLEQARGEASVERTLRVIAYKTTKYTVERPLHIGAALAGADARHLEGLSRYALPLGEAFQLRDDILGVFGDPAQTGKPAGDDLREGKRTLLVVLARQRAGADQAATLAAGLGRADLSGPDVVALREVIVDTGALAAVEDLIVERTTQAAAALSELRLTDQAREELAALAIAATARSL